MKKLAIDKNSPYSVRKNGKMKEGTMLAASYKFGGGVTMILVAEGWRGGHLIDEALDNLNSLIEGKNA